MVSGLDLPSLLQITNEFLAGNGFSKTGAQLQKEAKKRGLSLNEPKPNTSLPALESIYKHWQTTQPSNESEGSQSESEESSSASSDSDETSDSSDDGSDSESEVAKAKQAKTAAVGTKKLGSPIELRDRHANLKGTKRKRDASSSESSSSESASSSESSSSESDSGDESPPSKLKKEAPGDQGEIKSKKLPNAGAADAVIKVQSDSSDSSSESAVDSSDASSEQDSASSDSDNEEEEEEEEPSSSSDGGSEPEIISVKINTAPIKEEPTKSIAAMKGANNVGSESSGTLTGSPVPVIKQEPVDSSDADMHPSRKRRMDQVVGGGAAQTNGTPANDAKRRKKTNEPFSRIPKDQPVDPRLASNKYVPYDYANRAHERLVVTKGKGFTKEKNKGKRGSYKGGQIDLTPKGIKFED